MEIDNQFWKSLQITVHILAAFLESGLRKYDFFIANYRLLDGGLEARLGHNRFMHLVLPSSPYESIHRFIL